MNSLQKKTQNTESIEFSKKEHLLYSLLLDKSGEICERDTIIHAVWPESEEIGVSDWTIDRLVARLRHKLLIQKSDNKIVTVKTRGYKLVQS
jgi:DNA-binding winged helix-turn-helix (wHTH) protein